MAPKKSNQPSTPCSIDQACEQSGLAQGVVIEFVRAEWIIPLRVPENTEELIFDEEDIARICLIRDLREAFGVNDEAIPIILHLVDQLNTLRFYQSKAA